MRAQKSRIKRPARSRPFRVQKRSRAASVGATAFERFTKTGQRVIVVAGVPLGTATNMLRTVGKEMGEYGREKP